MSIIRYGYPFEQRIKELADSKPPMVLATWAMDVKGEKLELTKFKVPIELPKYRLANGRTAALQEQWLATNPSESVDFFEKDPELDVVQETQHHLLMELVKEADLQSYFKDKANKQVEPIILDENGFVVNGNRRLSCWRDLYYNESSEYPHFSHIDVVVLPHCDDKEIDRIEANLQIKKDIRAKYSWEARAIMMRQKQKQHGFTDTELAELYDMSEAEVKQTREMLDMADSYLKSREQSHQWQNVGGAEEAFKQLYKATRRTSTAPEQALLKNAAFALIDKPGEAGERLYGVIPKIQEFLPKVKAKLAHAFKVEPAPADQTTQELFGGGPVATQPDVSYALAAEIVKPTNSDKVRALVVEVIEAENELQKERNNAGYLLKMLKDANSKLQAAVSDGLRSDSSTVGAAGQIESIETLLGTIKNWLAQQNA
ncbi:conserved hypothetical protein [Cupriavidus taiwanensis]|uniref:hypothetical protein n=1 Tax=Cupriavidus taiwanensis TaxID=164546 RepID=UPI000E17FFBD|nr:hypothetical protein [Cupriavidus taiwanensis]SPA25377.1 conserved hypothetical protein [Cupriavidus taiwanensis]